jgi:Protein of unknown function (DUF2730)
VNFLTLPWENVAALLGIGTAVLAVISWFGRTVMSRNFVSHRDHLQLGQRLEAIAQQFAQVATKDELAEVRNKLAPVETAIAVLGEKVQSVQQGVTRTEHMVSMLVEHQLNAERAP